MAKNREQENEYESDSGDDDSSSVSSSEETGSSDSEPEREKPLVLETKLSSPGPAKSQSGSSSKPPPPPSPSEDEESGSESDGPDPSSKPVLFKPAHPDPKPKKSVNGAPSTKANSKRPAEETETKEKNAKKLKKAEKLEKSSSLATVKDGKKPMKADNSEKSSGLTGEDTKRQLFQRLWSENDEVALLKGMIAYQEKNNRDPYTDLDAFHEFIKEKLHVEVSRKQMQHKIRRMKKKYENNASKEKDGKDRLFSNPHEQKCYLLSKQMWGNKEDNENGEAGLKVVVASVQNGNGAIRSPVKEVKIVDMGNGGVDLVRLGTVGFDHGSVREFVLRTGARLFEGDNAHEGQAEWRKLQRKGLEIHMMELDLMKRKTKLVLDALKPEDDDE